MERGMNEMHEQRREERTHLFYYIKVFDPGTDELLGHIVDISNRGAMITTTQPLERNSKLELALEDTLDMDVSSRVHITAECRWCKNDFDNGLFDAGVEFDLVSNKAREIIQIHH